MHARLASFAVGASLLAVVVSLAACSGGGDRPAGTCTRYAGSSGPGDTLGYFPVDVGRTWRYLNQESAQSADLTVTGTQTVGGELAYVFSVNEAGSADAELVAKRASGAYVLASSSIDAPLDQLYPSLILPFPVAVTAPIEIVRCSWIEVGDLDQDGKVDHADVVASLRVPSVTETADLAAGSFTDVAHAETTAQVTVTATRGGSATVSAKQDEWYAKGVGRVLARLEMTLPSGSQPITQVTTTSLQSWTAPPSSSLVRPSEVAPEAVASRAVARAGSSLDDAALRLARRVVGR